ncbi:hypothetical protein PHYSODRAFT_509657 [Phytophthora sojae]|uniref:Integrase catalytic domain-containing protein n=1 Tax=Phytophthora sojae (strain P6497) TaxID=1094619 RepID=G4ZPZ5_PHYSP|nr:hypothetical protein PHYSODRAFT_509657 [Phytophthora sojae]EGZ16399.1 hypothetical protein PHYSODRAFT_509657 [Phytophthora sojae]|eukprot:XP_009530148.1 hypothetical protein PHYSODRAFT_509657 [Phytophthora sojae]
MYQTMKTSLWWKGMEAHIVQYVRNYLACTKSKHPIVKYGKLPAKTVVVRPWFEVAIDSIEPYGKNKFRALTMIDTSTRLTEIQPVDDASSDDAAFVFDRFWLCHNPRPVRVIYDQGTEFKKEFFELLESFGIHAIPTTTRKPQANGIIERLHRVIGEKMRTQTINTKDDWSGDKVLLRNDAGPQAKMAPLFSVPHNVVAVRTNGTLVLNKGKHMETVHIRRVVPFKSQRGEDCQQSDL